MKKLVVRPVHAFLLALVACMAPLPMESRPKTQRESGPYFTRLLRWSGGWVASGEGTGVYQLDLERSVVRRLEHPEVDRVLSVVQAGKSAFLFGNKKSLGKLYRVSGDFAEYTSIPREVYSRPETWHLAATEKQLVFFDNVAINSMELDRPEVWKRIPLKTELWSDYPYGEEPKTFLLTSTHLYAAYDGGEFGGGLSVADLSDGTVSLVGDRRTPATGLAQDDQGRIWASWGLAHLGGYEATLRVCEKGEWKSVSDFDSYPAKAVNWPFKAAAFHDVTTDPGRLFLLDASSGIVELRDGIWRQRLPGLLKGVHGSALAVDGDQAIIAAQDEGVVVANLRTRTVQTLPFSQRGK